MNKPIDPELLQRAIHVLEDEGEVSDEQFFLIKGAIREWHVMKKALEWYADEKNHDWSVDSFDYVIQSRVMKDEGERARLALKGVSNDLLTNG